MGQLKIVKEARKLVGVAQWKWGASLQDAPRFFDCSSLIQWLYKQKGEKVPRRAKEQMEMLNPCYPVTKARTGDLLFCTSPYVRGVKTEKHEGLHVSLVVSRNNVVCATNSELGRGIVEISIDQLLGTRKFVSLGVLVPGWHEGWYDNEGNWFPSVRRYDP